MSMTPRAPHSIILDRFLEFTLREINSDHHWEQSINAIRAEAQRVQKVSKAPNPVFIIIPLCHGNGGWSGSRVYGEYRTVREALNVRPTFVQIFDPYSNSIINEPRICKTNDPNDALYIFSFDEDCLGRWEKVQ